MTRRGLRFALLVGVLAGLSFPGSAAAEQLTLTVVGGGTVSGSYGFLGLSTFDCGPDEVCEVEIPRTCPSIDPCSPAQRVPQIVDLTANAPPAEWVFVEWGGHCSGSDTECSLTMDADRNATASFRHQPGRIVFTSSRDGDDQIYVMNADGTGQMRLTNNARRDEAPAWSPDGRRIVFTGGPPPQIYVMDADGSGETQLTNISVNSDPSWSPDGQRIAFQSYRDGPFNPEIYVMKADGSDVTRLTTNSFPDSRPAWSPDGQRIVFTSDRGDLEIVTMNLDGSGETLLTNNVVSDHSPAWSPDGQRIAFVQATPGNTDAEIYAMDPNGSNSSPLTASTGVETHPVWAPDGQQIAFTSRRNAPDDEIYVMSAGGSGEVHLPGHPSERDVEPSWTSASVRSQLFVGKAGSGAGAVTSSAGIDCGTDCWELYEPDTQVTLSAIATNGSLFVGWSDACSGTQSTCVVTMDNSKNVTATFFLLPIGQGTCTHSGTSGNDVIIGTPGNDIICAGAGNDIVRGLGGNDVIRLEGGNDKGYGGAGKDRIVGGKGKDRLFGGAGNDMLLARDRVRGELVDGGAGRRDRCTADRRDIKRRCP